MKDLLQGRIPADCIKYYRRDKKGSADLRPPVTPSMVAAAGAGEGLKGAPQVEKSKNEGMQGASSDGSFLIRVSSFVTPVSFSQPLLLLTCPSPPPTLSPLDSSQHTYLSRRPVRARRRQPQEGAPDPGAAPEAHHSPLEVGPRTQQLHFQIIRKKKWSQGASLL